MHSMIKITINTTRYIPYINRKGPILHPVLVAPNVYEALENLGFPIKVIPMEETKVVITKKAEPEVIIKNKQEPVIEPVAVEEIIEEEPIDESVETEEVPYSIEETIEIEQAEVIEIIENDADLSADSYYTEDFLTSKAMCKKILDNRNIQYESSASFARLKELVLESNIIISE